jgi:hypothetical protein
VLWRLYRYQDYPASEPPVCAFKVQTGAQLKDFRTRGEVSDLGIYYNCPKELSDLNYIKFLQHYNTSTELPTFFANKHNSENNFEDPVHFFKIYIDFSNRVAIQYVYVPVRQVKRYVHLEMLHQTSGEIYYLHLFLLNRPATDDKDACTHQPIHGGGEPVTYGVYQQSANAHGYVNSVVDACETFDDMCTNVTAAQRRSYFVVLTLQGYATHPIFDMPKKCITCFRIT